ncbi:ABC transporter ATP-binding protein [Microbacterium sp. gxy059]|uniref:ABC transporter ATP-binding protein n=1 Tax=Microbacterium sp. gxy059 TaxID=2957199 RepID=UPI003D9807BB
MIRRLLGIAATAWPWLAGSLVARILNLAAGIALIALPAAFVVRAAEGAAPPLAAVGGILVAVAVLKGLFRYLEHYLGHRAAFSLIADMRLAFFDALLPLAPDDETGGSGDLTTVATRDIDRVEVFFAHTLVPAVTAVLIPAGVVAALAAGVGAAPAGVALAAFAVGGVVAPLLGARRSASASREVVARRADIAQQVTEDIQAATEIRTLGAAESRLSALASRDADLGRAVRRAGAGQSLRAAIGLAWPLLAAIGIVALASPETIGAHVVAAAAVLGAAPAVSAVEALTRSLPTALASARRFDRVLARTPSIASPPAPEPIPEGALGIELDGVRAGYGDAPDVIDGLTRRIGAGETLAVVGPSGSGKSTLASLLTRQRDPREGAVRLVGASGAVDVRRVDLAELRRVVAIVEQRPVLLRGTVLDNLRLGSPALTEDEAWRALDDAALGDDVRAHPDGLRAALSDDALSLSGGQRQRLTLARALARDPRILVLDEATSHQDPETQRALREAIAARPGITTVVIAHRADAIRGADGVLRMGGAPTHSGSVAAPGPVLDA